MSSPELSMLLDMGFDKGQAEHALQVTGNQGVEPALEWLLAHSEELTSNQGASSSVVNPVNKMDVASNSESEPDPRKAESALPEEAGNGEDVPSPSEAKSFKCDECGKLFKSQEEMEFHAAKSKHQSFSESTDEKKALTEDEKREQLRKLEEKMRAKRLEREESEKKDALEREKNRIRSGKEITAAKKKIEEQEMKKIVEQRKREKLEEKLARQRVKEQIEQDKLARKAKFSSPPGQASFETPTTVQQFSVSHESENRPVPSSAPKEYNQTKLQIRLTNGQTLTQTFGAKEQLSAVRLFVEMNRTDGAGPFHLMTNFPRRVFNDEDYEKPLDVLGLVPDAVVIVSRGNN